ncbi:MAG: pyruvate, orthophosphate dikinase [Candidatus Woesearchaeota archaeon]|nr:pyruvate, orthophosphate dikinase [Candidatus Woesearchaeota archaeon]
MKKYVFSFEEGSKDMKELLGGKGAGLAEMTRIGLPVPPGITITTEACKEYYEKGQKLWPELKEQVLEKFEELQKKIGLRFGDKENPLLVSVRSGAAVSMPGMMDTILNLGLNDETVFGLAKNSNNERFAYDSYRRFIQMFGNVVLSIDHSKFEKILEEIKQTKGYEQDVELTAEDLKEVVKRYKELIKAETGKEFPQEPMEQLWLAVEAVFKSWNNERAIEYRRIKNIKGLLGTAVNIQAMVFGNLGDDCGTGVCFTRNPATGENELFGEYLPNAQGEDVVAGIRTPLPISELKNKFPELYEQLLDIKKKLENHYKDMQDIEFTVQKGKLYLLQTRTGQRTGFAAVKIAVDLVNEGIIDKKTALMRIEPESLNQLLHKRIDPVAKEKHKPIARGLPASPGAAVGKVVLNSKEAFELAEKKEKVILVRTETSPEDIKGMNAAQGILTQRGGMTSHAAVVARGMGKCAVVGCSDLIVDEDNGIIKVKDLTIKPGDWITLDGNTGEVYLGQLPLVEPDLSGNFETVMSWAKEVKTLGVRTNADTPKDAQVARNFGAEGIGLCRTEHMFFEGDRITAVREMILAGTKEEREKALNKILPMQKEDFYKLFKVMDGLPVTIRLLDPPLHEFLPKEDEEINSVARELGVSPEVIKEKVQNLMEVNPMLGHRGCRLLLTYPEITEMQTKAIMLAAVEAVKEGIKVEPQIMVPLVGHYEELKRVREVIERVAQKILEENNVDIKYKVGTMIEVPRAALTSDEIANYADFFSFGTNDLTQMTFGFSRDDIGKFLPTYLKEEILEDDPFKTVDIKGVGKLMKFTLENGKAVNPNLSVGICGEQGGEPRTVDFCREIKLDYVSCSPYRVPIAILAAAQAEIRRENKN